MMLRSFLALAIPVEIQDALSGFIAPLQKALPKPLVRWVPPHNIHLTLKFLGDVPPADLDKLAGLLRPELARCDPFNVSIGGLGAFPTHGQPRTLWVGVEAPPGLEQLARVVETACARQGFALERRPFSPHLTIGRVSSTTDGKDALRIRATLGGMPAGVIGQLNMDALHMFKSDLQPEGAVYTLLYTLPLRSDQTR